MILIEITRSGDKHAEDGEEVEGDHGVVASQVGLIHLGRNLLVVLQQGHHLGHLEVLVCEVPVANGKTGKLNEDTCTTSEKGRHLPVASSWYQTKDAFALLSRQYETHTM